jgi:acyl carrier protein
MVPSVFVFLDCLPIGPNGKLCRADLPAPDYTLQANDTLVVHARNEIEARVCAVWRDLLGKESIGIRDNFFDLGGHSLLVIELQRRLEDVFDRKVPVVEIFGNPTIEGLSTFFAPFESDITPSTVESRAEKQRRALADVAAARRRNRGTTAPVSR